MKTSSEEAKHLLALADRDFRAFTILKSASNADWSSACFHAQQAVEKWLKAVLVVHGKEVPKTHDVVRLAKMLLKVSVDVPVDLLTLGKLNPYAVTLRYDSYPTTETISREDAQLVVDSIRSWAESTVETSK